MNYYIQGDKEKAQQIKAAFEKAGIDTGRYDFSHEDVLYFNYRVKGETYMMSAKLDTGLDGIIVTHPDYKELELPVKPNFKVGDWIACDADSLTLSIKSVRDENYYFNQGGSLPIKDVDERYHLWTIADANGGDVLALNGKPFIYSSHKYGKNYCYIDDCEQFRANFNLVFEGNCVCPATKEQRDLLFAKMKEAGYEWDTDKKELKKIQPHYDISNFHAGMPVLVRDKDNHDWNYVLFSHRTKYNSCRFGAGSTIWEQCIPFNDDTKHLLGTTDMCDECYINW